MITTRLFFFYIVMSINNYFSSMVIIFIFIFYYLFISFFPNHHDVENNSSPTLRGRMALRARWLRHQTPRFFSFFCPLKSMQKIQSRHPWPRGCGWRSLFGANVGDLLLFLMMCRKYLEDVKYLFILWWCKIFLFLNKNKSPRFLFLVCSLFF